MKDRQQKMKVLWRRKLQITGNRKYKEYKRSDINFKVIKLADLQ